ncbi:Integrase catalytic region [Candidatus Jidaibacter acanthamoeba]|uniref:Integrase catalytic region n=1 Tax=Candidatus Jidaibacter acanthamoebae TaxID=86105 RepID=A0A0C1QH39_9RICK|nr:IS6 family transposase [Candidatus Jidaibacter acanthamoeba]KIE04874.1 Integrase catalytic region [Candidatus Jidaibacter acanthamoeba]KIE04876.1 Integrase catalytic region [Candidatus Jidaibacter acanthamoeba]
MLVMLYHRYSLSLRDISEILLYRNIEVSHESIREWNKKFGSIIANNIGKKRSYIPGDKWHLDEMRVVIRREVFWLWRAIDNQGQELDILLQKRRNTKAALRFFKKLLKRHNFIPKIIVTDKLRSYGSAKKSILKSSEHRKHKRLNNLIENSHQPTRQRERQMRKFKDPVHTQRFLSSCSQFLNLLKVNRYKFKASEYKNKMRLAFKLFNEAASQHYYV